MDLSCTVTEIDFDFSRKSHIFPPGVYFASPVKEFPSELGIIIRAFVRRTMSASELNLRQTDTGRQQRPRLRIALRGKNEGPIRSQKCWRCNRFDTYRYFTDTADGRTDWLAIKTETCLLRKINRCCDIRNRNKKMSISKRCHDVDDLSTNVVIESCVTFGDFIG